MRVAILSALGQASFSQKQTSRLNKVCRPQYFTINKALNPVEFISLIKPYAIVALTPKIGLKITAEILKKLPNLRYLVVFSTGRDWLDIEALQKQNIQLVYLPDYCSTSVAEHALGLLLTFSRRIHLSQMKSTKKIPQHISLRGFELRNKVLGIIGLGRIGKKVAKLAVAFGMKIIFTDPKIKYYKKIQALSQKDLLQKADMIVLSCPYTGKTIINKSTLTLCKAGAYIINPSRKDLVNNQAILGAIKTKKIAGYAVDDFILECDDLLEYGRLLQTYHTAWYSDEAIQRGTAQWVAKIIKTYQSNPKNKEA